MPPDELALPPSSLTLPAKSAPVAGYGREENKHTGDVPMAALLTIGWTG